MFRGSATTALVDVEPQWYVFEPAGRSTHVDMTQYRRDVLEFVVGPPDSALDCPPGEAAQSDLLQWSCGCEAEQQETDSYLVRPCKDHAQEFADG